MKFKAKTNGEDHLNFVSQLQRFADGFWLPDHVDEEQATNVILDAFKRKVRGQLELLDLTEGEEMNYPKDRDELRQRWEAGERFKFYFFYGHKQPESGVDASCLSQWFDAGFEVDDQHYATAEHWMMAEKARLFKDAEMLEAILAAPDPKSAKAFGRKVKGLTGMCGTGTG